MIAHVLVGMGVFMGGGGSRTKALLEPDAVRRLAEEVAQGPEPAQFLQGDAAHGDGAVRARDGISELVRLLVRADLDGWLRSVRGDVGASGGRLRGSRGRHRNVLQAEQPY